MLFRQLFCIASGFLNLAVGHIGEFYNCIFYLISNFRIIIICTVNNFYAVSNFPYLPNSAFAQSPKPAKSDVMHGTLNAIASNGVYPQGS